MKKIGFNEALAQIIVEDSRYDQDAYFFIREALDYTIQLRDKSARALGRHVSGQQLLEGARQYALQEFGPMAYRVLTHWGIHRSEDVGEIVFNLVNKGILGKTEHDRKSDFENGFDFEQAFIKPFQSPTMISRETAPKRSRATRQK